MQPRRSWSLGAGLENTEDLIIMGAARETDAVFKKSLLFILIILIYSAGRVTWFFVGQSGLFHDY
jgi:hypothetical protein